MPAHSLGGPDATWILDLGPGGAELLAWLGAPVREAAVLTTLGSSASPRVAYRVELADGRTVKLRRAATEDRARSFTRLAAAVGDPRLARVLARRGDVTLEELVPGTPLDRLELSDAHLADGAALLAAIHLADVPAGFPTAPAVSTEAARAGIETCDVITAFAGQTIKEPKTLSRSVADLVPGVKKELSVWRDGKTVALSVVVGGDALKPATAKP